MVRFRFDWKVVGIRWKCVADAKHCARLELPPVPRYIIIIVMQFVYDILLLFSIWVAIVSAGWGHYTVV